MQVSLSLENLPIQERIALVRQVWGSIVADYQEVTEGSLDKPVTKQELQQVLDTLSDMPNESAPINKTSQQVTNPTELQQSFMQWRQDYEKTLTELDDGWTDKDHDAIWDNVRNSNDTGRELSWDLF